VTAADIAARLAELTGGTAGQTAGGAYARACVDVPREGWHAAATVAHGDTGLLLTFFDWLTAVDAGEEGFEVVAHLWSVRLRQGALIRTVVPREDARLPSLVDVFAGAAWHERETAEMFGITFGNHPGLTKLLLPDEFEGHPLRKDFVLAARVAKAWPGAKEPGESESGAPSRRRIRPPGVPDPNEWGPTAGQEPPAPERPARRTRPAADPSGGEG
jgi:NADH-quinone oxidoreductase subunit C